MESKIPIYLTQKEISLLDYFIDDLENNMSNAGCNDLPNELINMFSKEEGNQIATEFALYNNPKEPEGPEWPIPDSCLLYWLKRKIFDQTKT